MAPTTKIETTSRETLPIVADEDVVGVRQAVRQAAVKAGMRLVDQTMIVTAASELARNALLHGGGGRAEVEVVQSPDGRTGVRLIVDDDGPGIADVEEALRDGFSTGAGMGLGLGGARRLTHLFEVRTAQGEGTTLTVLRWSG